MNERCLCELGDQGGEVMAAGGIMKRPQLPAFKPGPMPPAPQTVLRRDGSELAGLAAVIAAMAGILLVSLLGLL